MNMLASFTKRIILVVALILSGQLLFAADKTDGQSQKQDQTLSRVDSLKKLQPVVADSLKGQLYTQIAKQYLKYDTISSYRMKLEYQEAALRNTYLALHYYSRYNDTTGLVTCFNDLATVYRSQKKYTQAKWFILQSNTLSRAKNDEQNTVASLLTLATIKSDIKDYALAMRDLNEALSISSKNHFVQLESQVQLHYALLYNVMKNPAKADIAMKRHDAIDDSIKKAEEAALLAKQKIDDQIEAAKKNDYLTSSKKPYAFSSSKKPDTLQFFSLSSF
jgi:tetratricopeptide (TPR) repeat protein